MNNVLSAVLVLAGLGGALGLILAGASKVFHVEADERLDDILRVLPGAN
jgi:Na+-translocating ferredoxin:NAD+ oxidoreductase RNF subunit RnfB